LKRRESEKVIQHALNVPIWEAKKGDGSFLLFDMGQRVPKKHRNGTLFYSGAIHLWIYLCDWEVIHNGKLLAQSGENEDEITAALELMKGKQILAIQKADANTVEIKFTGKIGLTLLGNDELYEDFDDFFILYTPVGNVSYNKEYGFVMEQHRKRQF
jgi:hypothetical protein